MFNKILVINLLYIGDLLFTTPLLRALRNHYQQAHISLMVDAKNADVIKYNPHISQVIMVDKKGYHNKLSNYIKLIREVRKGDYDLVINLHRNERSSAIAAFSGGKTITGFATAGLGLFLDRLHIEQTTIHQAEAYLEILKGQGIKEFDNCGLELYSDASSELNAEQLWHSQFGQCPPKVIGLNTGGSWPTKRWHKSGFAELADKLLDNGYGVSFFGGPMDQDDVNEIISMMKKNNHENLAVFTGKTTLLELACLVKKCKAFVTGDSGPMHIAASQQIPIIAIFGPSNEERYYPYQVKHVVLKGKADCRPCGRHQCNREMACMHEISSDEVFSQIELIL